MERVMAVTREDVARAAAKLKLAASAELVQKEAEVDE